MAAEGEEIKLLGLWASPFVIRVGIALNLKGLSYDFLEEPFGKKSELLLKSNPVYKKMPVFIHKGIPICESMIILQYIDEFWTKNGPSILPSDPHDRAVARFWAVYIDDKLPAVIRALRGANKEGVAEAEEQAATALKLLEEALEKCSKGKEFFGGGTIGYVDIALGSCLAWIKASEVIAGVKILDEAKLPKLVDWAGRFCAHEAVREVMPSTEEMVEFNKKVQAVLNASPA